MMALPIFQLGSNIWTGAWVSKLRGRVEIFVALIIQIFLCNPCVHLFLVHAILHHSHSQSCQIISPNESSNIFQNMFSGIVTIMLCCFGQLSMKKAQGLLLMSLVVTVVNLINLLVLEVGEWRGFLSQADEEYISQYGLNYLMKAAYICTTLSTIVAMVASFLGSQHTFCFLQLRAEEESARKISGDTGLVDTGDKRHRHDDDGLNLKTPGPKPHPSWVYRYNMSTEERIGVQRSLSLLQHTRQTGKPGAGSYQRLDLMPPLPRDLSPPATVVHHPPQISTISDKVESGMRHAIIRRHNSMYTASTRTPHNPYQPPYKLHDVSGASEVRPIVTLQRSKTSVTPSSGPFYRTSNLHNVTR